MGALVDSTRDRSFPTGRRENRASALNPSGVVFFCLFFFLQFPAAPDPILSNRSFEMDLALSEHSVVRGFFDSYWRLFISYSLQNSESFCRQFSKREQFNSMRFSEK